MNTVEKVGKAEKPKRKLLRSPNYPGLSLGEALSRIKTLFDQEKRVATTPDVILKHLGFTERSGPGGRTLSALRQYGLLEDHGDNYRVSDLGYTLLAYPDGSPEREAALKEAAQKPTLFKELLATYKDGLPSNATLRSYLLKKGFNPTSIDHFIRIFTETIELAHIIPGTYNGVGGENTDGGSGVIGENEPQDRQPQAPGIQTFSWPISSDPARSVKAELRILGRDVRPEDVERLKRYLDLWKESFPDHRED